MVFTLDQLYCREFDLSDVISSENVNVSVAFGMNHFMDPGTVCCKRQCPGDEDTRCFLFL